MHFKVKKQFGRGKETLTAQFADQADARLFIQVRLATDAKMKIEAVYKLYEFDDLIEEFDAEKLQSAASKEESGSQGKGSTSGFRPTPFSTSPKPSGMPSKWSSSQDEDEDDSKK